MMFTGVQWGTDPISETNPENGEVVEGRQINLFDANSGIIVNVPFAGESLVGLVGELIQGLTEDQRRSLIPKVTGGIVLPNGVAKRASD
jgi:hypothetical protein